MRLVLATRNDHKLRELAQIMAPIELEPLPAEVGRGGIVVSPPGTVCGPGS